MRETDSGTLKEWISNIQTAWNATKTDVKAKEVAFKGTETNTKQLQYNSLYRIVCCIDRFAGNIRILFYYICLFLHHTQTSIKSMLGYAFQNVDVTSTFRLLKDTVSSVNVWRF